MATADRPIATVLHDIVGNIQEIIRSELRLAKTELTDEVSRARNGAILCGVGAFMVVLTVIFLLLSVVYALSLVLPAWAAALIVAGAVGVVAAICLGIGIRKFKSMRGLPKTAATLKENAEWAKQLTR